MQEIKKEYVSILAQIHRDGSIQPLGILLEDGRKYDIDEVKDKCRAASLKAGAAGFAIRYGSARGTLICLTRTAVGLLSGIPDNKPYSE